VGEGVFKLTDNVSIHLALIHDPSNRAYFQQQPSIIVELVISRRFFPMPVKHVMQFTYGKRKRKVGDTLLTNASSPGVTVSVGSKYLIS
jgi:hypothetical protein